MEKNLVISGTFHYFFFNKLRAMKAQIHSELCLSQKFCSQVADRHKDQWVKKPLNLLNLLHFVDPVSFPRLTVQAEEMGREERRREKQNHRDGEFEEELLEAVFFSVTTYGVKGGQSASLVTLVSTFG